MAGKSFEQIWIFFIQEHFVSSLIEMGPEVLEKNVIVVNVFLLFQYYLPFDLHLKKFESPSPKNALCYVWLK